jgi:membrane-bound serine protease (ClpP class)
MIAYSVFYQSDSAGSIKTFYPPHHSVCFQTILSAGCYIVSNLRLRLAISALFALLAGPAQSAPRVLAIDVNGVVHPVTVEIVGRALEQAQTQKAELVLLRLNTPGGLMEAMRETIEKLIASPVPVAAYVTPSGGRAASAGFFLLQAGDIAAMAPGTNTGAAHPVLIGTQMDPVMKQKVENDAAAYLRSIVAKRGRNSALAEKAVLESKSFTEKEALDQRLIDLVARSEQELLARLDGREVVRFDGSRQKLELAGATVTPYELSLRQRILAAISDPNLALVLLVLGILGIYVEFSSPGLIVPGVGGAILALLGLSAISVLPINWLGAALLILALVLFALEAKFTSHGILGAGGAVAMVLGSLLLIESPLPEMRIRLSTALALALPFSFITVLLVTLVVKARHNKVITGSSGMLGEIGSAIEPLAPQGKILVRGEYWEAVSTAPVPAGARVRVVAIDKLQLTVEPISDSGGSHD